jgi:hypothetical protein
MRPCALYVLLLLFWARLTWMCLMTRFAVSRPLTYITSLVHPGIPWWNVRLRWLRGSGEDSRRSSLIFLAIYLFMWWLDKMGGDGGVLPCVTPNWMAWPVRPTWPLCFLNGTQRRPARTSLRYARAFTTDNPCKTLAVSKVFLKWTLRSLALALATTRPRWVCRWHQGGGIPFSFAGGCLEYFFTIKSTLSSQH